MKATDYAGPQLFEPVHDEQLQRFLDSVTGKRPLTCCSRAGIPMHVEDNDRAAEYQGARLNLMCCFCETFGSLSKPLSLLCIVLHCPCLTLDVMVIHSTHVLPNDPCAHNEAK
jgi:hypothetical protein